jgi:hypothetical protein
LLFSKLHIALSYPFVDYVYIRIGYHWGLRMARKKRITLTLIILLTLLLAGPGVVDIANADSISSSIPAVSEQQSVFSTLTPSDSIDDGSAQESVRWNQGWNSFDGNWFYVDSVNPVSLHSGWLYTNGAWY